MKKNKVLTYILDHKNNISIILKYLFCVVITVFVCLKSEEAYYLLAGALELCLIFGISNTILGKYKIGYFINSMLLFLYNVQMMVFIFGKSFITLMMLTNLDSLKALSGKAGIYLFGVVLVVIFSFLPIKHINISYKKALCGIALLFGAEVCLLAVAGNWYSPIYGYVIVGEQYYTKQKTAQTIAMAVKNNTENDNADTSEFYRNDIKDYRTKDNALYDNPNVILIFTEGLSENVVSDERNITPNIQKWKNKSLNFENYYNHTFATYRGINGQLYSGYQLGDIENNYLISMQSIFSDRGYETVFLNTEPENKDFTNYLEQMGFDEVVSDNKIQHRGLAGSISDEDAYEMLYDIAAEKVSKGNPFFLSVYTFGTHASFDSVSEKYGDGKDPVLNRFADMDAQFGMFMDKINKNPHFRNTIIVFTTDHATYQDDPFSTAFPEHQRFYQSFDKIPFFIYYQGIEPETVDAAGRNSLDLAPTVMDYLDISAPNYFLGSSLFARETGSILETTYHDSVVLYSSQGGNMQEIETGLNTNILETIHKYYVIKAMAE